MAELLGALAAPDGGRDARRGDDAALAGQRVVIVTNRPTHYRVPLFNRLSRRLAAAGGSLHVLFTSDLSAKPWMRPDATDFEHTTLDTRLARRDRHPRDRPELAAAPPAPMAAAPLDLRDRLRLAQRGVSPPPAARSP